MCEKVTSPHPKGENGLVNNRHLSYSFFFIIFQCLDDRDCNSNDRFCKYAVKSCEKDC